MRRPGRGPRVRAATVADLPRIVEIDAGTFPALPYPEFFLRQAIDAFGGLLRVVETPAGDVAGFALSILAAGETTGWLLAMAVAREHRGAGLGSLLLADALAGLPQRGATEVRLTVEPDNELAVAMYLREGFEPAGDDPDYFGSGERRLVMRRVIGDW